MLDKTKLLEQFEKYKDYTEDRINLGIEKNRKGFAHITIKDEDGNLLNGRIKIKQKNHAFKFGANIFMLDQLENEDKNNLYKEYFKELFNMATLPFYWIDLEPEKGKPRYSKDSINIYRRPAIDKCMEFCQENNIEPREHALAYEHFFPKWLADASVEEVKSEYERRCKEISERYADKINTIEVTNETWWGKGVTAIYEDPDFVEYAFKTARKYFPKNKLGINEYSAIWSSDARAADRYYAQIESALLKGTPIDAIGMQYHMFSREENYINDTRKYYNPKHLYKTMDLYSRFNKPIQVTEVTIPCYSNDEENEELQAEILKWLYSIWFSHENTEQIIYWNGVDGYAAFTEPGNMTGGENYYYGGLVRFDFTKKPSYYMLKDLIHNVWHTQEEKDFADGWTSFKGFYGDYDLEISVDGQKYEKEISLRKNYENEFEIIVK